MRRLKKILFSIGITLLLYGYLSRILKIYFFWESKTIGWIILFIALLVFLIELFIIKKRNGQKIIGVTIGICFLTLGLFIIPIVVTKIRYSDAYQATIEYMSSNSEIKADIGNIKGFGLIPIGSVEVNSINGALSGTARLEIIVKGDKKYKDITVNLRKSPDTSWTITSTE